MASSSEAVRRRLADMRTGFDQVRSASYEGRDPAGLATATVDGTGLLTELRLASTIARHPADEVGEAVRAAVADANHRRTEALVEVARSVRGAERSEVSP